MNKLIHFDHCYTMDRNHLFLKKLGLLGFSLDPRTIIHPGNRHCRFIEFKDNTYLEFINQAPPAKKSSGFSFIYKGKLKSFFEMSKRKGVFKLKYIHRNYNWKENNKDNLPGWNFVTFSKTGIIKFYPWFTEYESKKKRKKSPPSKTHSHKNGIVGVHGHEFVLNERGREFFSTIFGCKITDILKASDGIFYYFKRGRSNRHTKVILKSKDLKKTSKITKIKTQIVYEGHLALNIKNPNEGRHNWDVLIIESKK